MRLSVEAPANGRIKASTINVLGDDGRVVLTDKADLTAILERRKLARRLAARIEGEDPGELERHLEQAWADAVNARAAEEKEQAFAPRDGKTLTPEEEVARRLAEIPQDVRDEAETMLLNPLLLEQLGEDIALLGVAGEFDFAATVYLAGTSRLLKRPLALRGHGPSASGKSFIVETTARLFPEEAVILASQMTPQALFHMRAGSLAHRFIVAGERSRVEDDERAEATRALREMISSGRLTKLMPMKVPGGEIETVLIVQEGPVAYVETTTLARVFDEDENRCVALHTDEREEQTRRILRKAAEGYAGASDDRQVERVIRKHHALQRMLAPLSVTIPYAARVGEKFGAKQVEARRAFPHVMGVVQAVALLFQRQRGRDDQGRIVAAQEDYLAARALLARPILRLLGGGVSGPAERFLERLRTWATGEFTTTEARQRETTSRRAVQGWLPELAEAGLVELVEERRGPRPARWKLAHQPPETAARAGLPTTEEVFG